MRFIRFEPHGRFHSSKPHPLPTDLPVIGFGLLIVVVVIYIASYAFPTWTQNWNRYPAAEEVVLVEYPSTALEQQLSGDVVVRFKVRQAGSVESVEVIYSDPPGIFDEAVRDAVLASKYRLSAYNPPFRNRKELRSDVVITQRFLFDPESMSGGRHAGRAWPFEQVIFGAPDVLPKVIERHEPDPLEPTAGFPSPRRTPWGGEPFVVTMTVTPEGRVTFPRFEIRFPAIRHYGDEILDAFRQWRFAPAMRNGKPVAITICQMIIVPYASR